MNHINNDCEINVPPSHSLTPSFLAMSAPQRLTPDRLPDPWLRDSESLLFANIGQFNTSLSSHVA
jgi:hypothetical protein